jgi:hypothetical protein
LHPTLTRENKIKSSTKEHIGKKRNPVKNLKRNYLRNSQILERDMELSPVLFVLRVEFKSFHTSVLIMVSSLLLAFTEY